MFLNCFQVVTTFKIVSCDSYFARRLLATSCNETNYYIFCCAFLNCTVKSWTNINFYELIAKCINSTAAVSIGLPFYITLLCINYLLCINSPSFVSTDLLLYVYISGHAAGKPDIAECCNYVKK